MKRNKNIKIILSLAFVLFVLSIQNVQADTFGVAPNYIQFPSALRNETYEHELYVYNENNYDQRVEFEVTGLPSWIDVFEYDARCCPITESIVENDSYKTYLLEIKIPKDAKSGEYNAFLYADFNSTKNDTTDGNSTAARLILPVEIRINVTGDQNYNVTISDIYIRDVEVTQPFTIPFEFENLGNVVASPTIEITFTKDGNYIDKITETTAVIKPTNIYYHKIEWDTVGKISGKYNANIKIFEGNNILEDTNLSFELFPPGSVERNGTFQGFRIEGDLQKGKIVKIIGNFVNDGQIALEAQFFGEIYKDGELFGTIESPLTTIDRFTKYEFISYLTIQDNGEYSVKGYVLYGGTPTETKEITFSVGVFKIESILLPIFFVFIIVFVWYLLRKRRLNILLGKIGAKVKHSSRRIHLRKASPKASAQQLNILENIMNYQEEVPIVKKKKRKIHVKKKEKKPSSFSVEDMSAKEIEDYVKGL